jgi:predicted DNA-binding transcriptional regulator AlpA
VGINNKSKRGTRPGTHHIDRRADQLVSFGPQLGDDHLLPPLQLAVVLGLSTGALEAWRHKGLGPRYIKLNERVLRYRVSDVRAWLRERATREVA